MKYEDIKSWKFYEPICDTIILDAIEYAGCPDLKLEPGQLGHYSCARVQKIGDIHGVGYINLGYVYRLCEKLKELKYLDEHQRTIITKEEFENIIKNRKQ